MFLVDLILSECAGFFAANTYELGARKYGKSLKKVLTNSNCYYIVIGMRSVKRGRKTFDVISKTVLLLLYYLQMRFDQWVRVEHPN
jgi:hypothetical protein